MAMNGGCCEAVKEMTLLDFFSGIGGFRRGFELCGMVCKGHCEIDRHADRSYRAMFDVKEDEWYRDDITKVQPGELPRVNLWCGGFPCQDYAEEIVIPKFELQPNK